MENEFEKSVKGSQVYKENDHSVIIQKAILLGAELGIDGLKEWVSRNYAGLTVFTVNEVIDTFKKSETKPTYRTDTPYGADFKKYYDSSQKRNIWALGYFGGGSVNIMDAYRFAADYSNANNVPIGAVKIDEILSSRRFKGFKILYSTTEQNPEPDAEIMDNVHQWLRD